MSITRVEEIAVDSESPREKAHRALMELELPYPTENLPVVRKPRRLVTAPLAGGAYEKRLQANKRPLTHAVELDDSGVPLRVLCGKVKLASVLDDATQYDVHPLDCDSCIRKFGVDS